MSNKDLLFELGCEELPASSLQRVAHAIQSNIEAQLKKAGIAFKDSELFFTPRRIAVKVLNLAEKQPEKVFERLGPNEEQAYGKDGMPTLACLGFVKSCNATLDDLSIKETKKGRYVACKCRIPGADTKAILPKVIEASLKKLPIPKPMRWSDHDFSFIRPVHWVVFLFGSQVIETTLFGKQSSNITYGHRFLSPEAIVLKTPKEYREKLLNPGMVIPGFEERKTTILQAIDNLSIPGGHAVIDDDLLDEVSILVEWPVILLGQFDQSFLTVPTEALVTSMQEHQRCFPVFNDQGQIQPYFIITSNIESKDPASVIKGNEKVIHARLSDAKFFYENDIRTPLVNRFDALKQVVFQKELGSVADKSDRVTKLVSQFSKKLTLDLELSKRAAKLAKCDLVSNMVYEFPELQGVMGEYYALHDHEDTLVASALKEQYLPRFSGDQLPTHLLSCSLALADRVDTLAGIFGINKKPTGDKDPFALRRAALGVVRLLIEKALPLDLKNIIKQAVVGHETLPNKETAEQLQAFIFERMKVWYQEKDISHGVFEAVSAIDCTHLADFDQRVSAVQHFLQLPEAHALAEANKRVGNILKKQDFSSEKVDASLFNTDQEANLFSAIESLKKTVANDCKEKRYSEALDQLATLKSVVDAFFDKVMVMEKDQKIRENRLALLVCLHKLLSSVADISHLNVKQ